MRVNKIVASAVVAVLVGLPSWTLHEVYTLRVEFTDFRAKVSERLRLEAKHNDGVVVSGDKTTYE